MHAPRMYFLLPLLLMPLFPLPHPCHRALMGTLIALTRSWRTSLLTQRCARRTRCVSHTIENVPKKATSAFCDCFSVCAAAIHACDAEHRLLGDALLMLLPRLLLTPLSTSWWQRSASKEMRTRCARFLKGEWRQLNSIVDTIERGAAYQAWGTREKLCLAM